MKRSTSTFKTEKGGRYLGQLVKHFAHKTDAAFEGNKGYIKFEFGTANMSADAEGLHITVEATDDELLARTMVVIESHLIRFAFREELDSLTWHDFTINA
ncbi:DUF2218 domain-containing protein [Maritalea sp.]|jgi:hypothetical protein|uniref:DUF2218 domain-containing protein n=1 Tax=Maritalea sp. TaxID=2003361 RepID=UPI0039E274B2